MAWEGPHALIIEDELLIALAVEAALRDLGFTSFAFAPTQDAAIAAAQDRCPDLISADLHLLSGTGLEAVQVICRDRPPSVVFISCLLAERCWDRVSWVIADHGWRFERRLAGRTLPSRSVVTGEPFRVGGQPRSRQQAEVQQGPG